jgi:hypothetical protein
MHVHALSRGGRKKYEAPPGSELADEDGRNVG